MFNSTKLILFIFTIFFIISPYNLISQEKKNINSQEDKIIYLEDIVVTAPKQKTKLQQIPIAITAFTSETIRRLHHWGLFMFCDITRMLYDHQPFEPISKCPISTDSLKQRIGWPFSVDPILRVGRKSQASEYA